MHSSTLDKGIVDFSFKVFIAATALIAAQVAWAGSSSGISQPRALPAHSFMAGCLDIDLGVNTTGSGRHYTPKSGTAFYASVHPYTAVRRSGWASLARDNNSLIYSVSSTRYGDVVRRGTERAKAYGSSPVKPAVFTVGPSDVLDQTGSRPIATTADARQIKARFDRQRQDVVYSVGNSDSSVPDQASGRTLLLLGFVMLGLVATRRAKSRVSFRG
jgi:hypothetical protein